MSKQEVFNSIKSLKSNPLISEIYHQLGDEKIESVYVTVTHHYQLFNNEVFNNLCDLSFTESVYCVDRETKEYETQLIINL